MYESKNHQITHWLEPEAVIIHSKHGIGITNNEWLEKEKMAMVETGVCCEIKENSSGKKALFEELPF